MNCHSNHSKGHGCSCHGGPMNNPVFWSTKKKIEMLKQHKECLENRLEDVNDALKELED